MNYKTYNWLINDAVSSLERLNYIYGDIQYFLEHAKIERIFTLNDGRLDELFDKSILAIADGLVEMDNKEFANNPDKNVINKVMDACDQLKNIAYDLYDVLTNENYHHENMILTNEPRNIWYNLNNIKNEIIH